jgi:hypothetical protein
VDIGRPGQRDLQVERCAVAGQPGDLVDPHVAAEVVRVLGAHLHGSELPMDLGDVAAGQAVDRMGEVGAQEPWCLTDRRWVRRPAPRFRVLPTLVVTIPLPARV